MPLVIGFHERPSASKPPSSPVNVPVFGVTGMLTTPSTAHTFKGGVIVTSGLDTT